MGFPTSVVVLFSLMDTVGSVLMDSMMDEFPEKPLLVTFHDSRKFPCEKNEYVKLEEVPDSKMDEDEDWPL